MSNIRLNIKPCYDKAFIRPIAIGLPLQSKLVLSHGAKAELLEKAQIGEVIALGPGVVMDGILVDPEMAEGDLVLFGAWNGSFMHVAIPGMEYAPMVMRFTDIFATLGPYTDELRAIIEPQEVAYGEEER